MAKILLLVLLFASGCSKHQSAPEDLPEYSDMGAAADAGRAPIDNP